MPPTPRRRRLSFWKIFVVLAAAVVLYRSLFVESNEERLGRLEAERRIALLEEEGRSKKEAVARAADDRREKLALAKAAQKDAAARGERVLAALLSVEQEGEALAELVQSLLANDDGRLIAGSRD